MLGESSISSFHLATGAKGAYQCSDYYMLQIYQFVMYYGITVIKPNPTSHESFTIQSFWIFKNKIRTKTQNLVFPANFIKNGCR